MVPGGKLARKDPETPLDVGRRAGDLLWFDFCACSRIDASGVSQPSADAIRVPVDLDAEWSASGTPSVCNRGSSQ